MGTSRELLTGGCPLLRTGSRWRDLRLPQHQGCRGQLFARCGGRRSGAGIARAGGAEVGRGHQLGQPTVSWVSSSDTLARKRWSRTDTGGPFRFYVVFLAHATGSHKSGFRPDRGFFDKLCRGSRIYAISYPTVLSQQRVFRENCDFPRTAKRYFGCHFLFWCSALGRGVLNMSRRAASTSRRLQSRCGG